MIKNRLCFFLVGIVSTSAAAQVEREVVFESYDLRIGAEIVDHWEIGERPSFDDAMRATGALETTIDEARWSVESFASQEKEGAVETGYRVVRVVPDRLTMEDRERVFAERTGRFPFDELAADYLRQLEKPELALPSKWQGESRNVVDDAMATGERVSAHLCAALGPEWHLPQRQIALEIAYPDLAREDAAALVDIWRAERAEDIAERRFPVEVFVAESGLTVTDLLTRRPCVVVDADAGELDRIAEAEAIATIVVAANRLDGGAEGDGVEVREGSQLQQFVDLGFDGETASSKPGGFNDITVAILDRGFQDRHLALHDGAPSSDANFQRVKARVSCTGGTASCTSGGSSCRSCSELNPFPPFFMPGCSSVNDLTFLNGLGVPNGDDRHDHGTTIFGIVAGDLQDAQDSSVPTADRGRRSGHAPEAGVVLSQIGTVSFEGDFCSDRAKSIGDAVNRSVDIATLSEGRGGDSGACSPAVSGAITCRGANNGIIEVVNDAFKDGLFFVKAAGNNGVSDSPACPCTVTSPGQAEGAFTVGGISGPGNASSQQNVREAGMYGNSSTGGGEMGRPGIGERTIIGLLGWACPEGETACEDASVSCPASLVNDYASLTIQSGCGTSYAAPHVAAAAAVFKEHWILDQSPASFLDDAAHFKTIMLLMGDRYDGGNLHHGKLQQGFGLRTGAGRLKQRMFNSQGMDAAWNTKFGSAAIADGATVSVIINPTSAPMNSTTDTVKVVVWWYEPMTETTGADITIAIEKFQNTNCTGATTELAADLSFDNKKMIRINSNVASQCTRLVIKGLDITPNDELSFLPIRTVNWALYAEDTARDDADGPLLTSPPDRLSVERP